MAQVHNMRSILKFFLLSCDEKQEAFQNKKDQAEKIDRGILCIFWKEHFEDNDKKILPCYHECHTNWIKTRLMKFPLAYPCTQCKECPLQEEEMKINFIDNLFDKKFLVEFGERKSEAIIQKDLKNWGLCQYKFILEPSEPDYDEKDVNKMKVSKFAAECKAKNRILCSECK